MNHSVVTSTSPGKLEAFCKMSLQEKLQGVLSKQVLVYKDLMGTALEQTLLNAFPIARNLLKDSLWQELITTFLGSYPHSPYFWLLPKGLSFFVRENGWNEKTGIPYLSELIDLEWMEIEVYMLPLQNFEGYYLQGDLMQDVLFINPDHRLAKYTYPVFAPSSLEKNSNPGRYDVLCFRSPKTREIRLMSLSPFYRQVMDLITIQDCTGKEAMQKAAGAFGIFLRPKIYEEGREFFQSLLSQEAILGFRE